MKAKIFAIIATIITVCGAASGITLGTINEENTWNRACDGTEITEKCTGEDGQRYKKYLFHEAVEEQTEIVHHDKIPAKTHVEHHPAVQAVYKYINHPAEYGVRTYTVCQQTTISYKRGTCAMSQCWDGEYSGSSGRGTCSYHGGVMRRGPFYKYVTQTYLKKAAWTEKKLVTPYKAAWNETVVDEKEVPAWDEPIVTVEAQDAYWEKELA